MSPRTTAPDPAPETPADDLPPTSAESPPADPPAESPFFAWLRRLDVPRRTGWLGGVCAGVAERLGVDPIIVRGVVVVIGVLGGPVALLYALAWFLLPDERGVIHAQELGRGRVTRALPGIVAVFLLSFLPLAQGFWFAGAFYWGDLGAGGVALRILWTGALVAGAIVLVVWLARRSSATEVTTTPATTDDRPDTVPAAPAAAAAPAASAATAVGEPPAPPADATAEDLAAWKRGQDEWQRQRAAWAAEQRRDEWERRQAEARERADAALAASRERARIDRLTRPTAHPGAVALILGLALLAAAIAAAVAHAQPATRGAHWLIGAATLVLVLGTGIVVVGLARRRSNGLTSLSITAVFLLALAAVVPTDRAVLPPGVAYGLPGDRDGRYASLAGESELRVVDGDGEDMSVIDLWQLSGGVRVVLEPGAAVRLTVVGEQSAYQVTVMEDFLDGSGRSSFYELGADGRVELTAGGGEPDAELRVWLGSRAWLSIMSSESRDAGPLPLDPAPRESAEWGEQPSPTPTPTEGATP